MKRKKVIMLLPLLMLLSLALASAYDGYYYPGSSSGSSKDIYKETTLYENKITLNQNYYWGAEKTTYYIKEEKTIEKNFASTKYSPSYKYDYYYKSSPYSMTIKYPGVSYSNWRFKEPYNCYDYECNPRYRSYNSYQRPYYYKPRYDPYLGYYNWRY